MSFGWKGLIQDGRGTFVKHKLFLRKAEKLERRAEGNAFPRLHFFSFLLRVGHSKPKSFWHSKGGKAVDELTNS
jgi:hypothetical protein